MRRISIVFAIVGVLVTQAIEYPKYDLTDHRDNYDHPDTYGVLNHHIPGDDRLERAKLETIDK
jgi:hypothetical protein